MSNASNWLEEAILNHFFRNGNITSPAQLFLALYKTDPTDFDTGTEVSGGGYTRQQIAFTAAAQVGNNSETTNSNAIAFPAATANWTAGNEKVGYWGVKTAASGGNLLAYGMWNEADARPVLKNDQFNVQANKVKVIVTLKAGRYMQNAIINHFFRGTVSASPAQIYLALYKSDPTLEDTGVEVSGGGYSRQLATFSAPTQTGGAGMIQNSAIINYNIATAEWGEIPYVALRSATTGGNLLAFGPWSISTTISTGQQYSVPVGSLKLTFA